MKGKEETNSLAKRITISSVLTVTAVLFGAFIMAVLINYEIISFKLADIVMYGLIFISSFASLFLVKSQKNRIVFNLMAVLLTFLMLIALGLLMTFKISWNNSIILLIILLLSAIINSIVYAII